MLNAMKKEKSRAKETRSASGEDTVLDREVILDVIEKEISKTWRKWLTQLFSEGRVIKAEVTSRGKVQMGRCLACSSSRKEARVAGGERAKKKASGKWGVWGRRWNNRALYAAVKTLASTLNEIGSHFQDFWEVAWSDIQQDHSGKMAAAGEAYFWDISESPCNNRWRNENEN